MKKNNKGVALLVIILFVFVIILCILFCIPFIHNYITQAQTVGCATQLRTAKSSLSISVLEGNTIDDGLETFVIMDETIPGFEGECPAGGTIYAIKDSSKLGYSLICGLHGKDLKQVTRLNAYNALKQIQENQETVVINGKTYTPVLVSEKVKYSQLSPQAKKDGHPVIYYGVNENGFNAKEYKENEVVYLAYADENYNASWSYNSSWTGTSIE